MLDLENVKLINEAVENVIQRSTDWEACTRWEKVEEVAVRTCQVISKQKAKLTRQRIDILYAQLEKAHEWLQGADNELEKCAAENQLEECQTELEKYLAYNAEGARVRSRSLWYQKSERNTKYFYGLERVKYSNKTLNAIMCNDGTITREEKKILLEQNRFYHKLYSKDPNVLFQITDTQGVEHSKQAQIDLQKDFSYEEFSKALSSMAKGKAPGNDGLSCSFYVIMWNKLGRLLWNVIQSSHHQGILFRSARRGVISLIPKKGKNPLLIGSWRPICLLNNT